MLNWMIRATPRLIAKIMRERTATQNSEYLMDLTKEKIEPEYIPPPYVPPPEPRGVLPKKLQQAMLPLLNDWRRVSRSDEDWMDFKDLMELVFYGILAMPNVAATRP